MRVGVLSIEGSLVWDTNKNNIKLQASQIIVENDGKFTLGTKEIPMLNNAEIYIRNIPNLADHPNLGSYNYRHNHNHYHNYNHNCNNSFNYNYNKNYNFNYSYNHHHNT